MKVRLFQYPLPAPVELEDLNAFVAANRVASLTHHVVASAGGGPMLVFVVQTVEGSVAGVRATATSKVDYRETLSPAEFATFSRLRAERKVWAEVEGVPVYTLFSNAQLAEIVTRRVDSIAALSRVDGIGPVRAEKYGVRVLAALAAVEPPLSSVAEASDPESAPGKGTTP